MDDLTITAASFVPSANANIIRGVAGEDLTQAQTVYLDPQTNSYKKAKANGAAPLYRVAGLSCNGASAGQPFLIVVSDPALEIGADVAAGDVLIASANPGGICLDANKASGWFVTVLALGIGNNLVTLLAPSTSPIAIP